MVRGAHFRMCGDPANAVATSGLRLTHAPVYACHGACVHYARLMFVVPGVLSCVVMVPCLQPRS